MHTDLDKEFSYELEGVKRMKADGRIHAYRVNWGTLSIWVTWAEGELAQFYWNPHSAMEAHFCSEADIF